VGQTLYFRASAGGSFKIVDTVTDAGSTPASATYPAISSAGWSHAAQTVTAPAGGPFTSSSFTWNAGAATPAQYTISAADTRGNESTFPLVFANDSTAPTYTLEVVAPAFNTTTPGYIRAGAQYYVYANVVDNGSGVASLTADVSGLGSGATPATFTASTYEAFGTTFNYRSELLTAGSALPEGGKNVVLTVTDGVGNAANVTKNVIVDNTAPSVTFTFPHDDARYNAATWAGGCGTAGMCGNASDPGSRASGVREVRVWVRRTSDNATWDGTAWQSTLVPLTAAGTTSWSFALPASALTNGVTYGLTAQVFDVAGNSSTPPTGVTFTFDTTPPTVTLVMGNGGGSSKLSLTGSGDPGASVTITLCRTSTPSQCAAPLNLTANTNGAGNYATTTVNVGGGLWYGQARQTDDAGNTGTSTVTSFNR
jgi:hypothetical protein